MQHLLKESTDEEHPRDILTWCDKRIWKYSGGYTFVFMIEAWIKTSHGVDICKDCWNAVHKRIGEK